MSALAQAATPLDTYEAYGCRLNAIEPDLLFHRYEQAGFLYRAKLRRLAPFFPQIVENWRRALRAGELIHWVASYDDRAHGAWASVSSWRSTHAGWNTQHLVSIGGPSGSRAVMLAGQAVRIREGLWDSTQSWFRPDNRFPNRLFGTVVASLGERHASVVPHVLLALPKGVARKLERSVDVTPVVARADADVLGLATRARGSVYADAEDLGHDDLLLESVDELYRQYGLRRYRRIWVAWDGSTAVGAAIAWRGPLGFNFSFLENRCDVLLHPDLAEERVEPIVRGLLAAAATAYADFPPTEVPVVLTGREAAAAARIGAKPVRCYTQSIWLREGFEAMYGHLARFYERIERASRSVGLGSERLPGDPKAVADV